MADESLLKDLYSRMPDQSLINKLFTERDQLSEDAVRIIKQEIARRNLNLEQLERENNLKEQQANEYESLKEQLGKNDLQVILNKIINDKKEGKTNNEIAAAYQQQGIKKEMALLLIADAKAKCISMIDDMWSNLFWGGMILAAGLILMYLASHYSSGTIFFLPLGALLYGIIKFVTGLVQLPARKVLNEIIENF